MSSVRGKGAIVTGGANGIGFQCCNFLLVHGAKAVAILDLPSSNGEKSVDVLNKQFGASRAFFFPIDVTKHAEFEVVFQKAAKVLGGLDILINNAGILNDAAWEKTIDVNFTAVVKNTLLAYDVMGKHKGGKGGVVVNIASVVGINPYHDLPVYSATKFGVVGFTLSLKEHFAKTGISVRVMCPGVTNTPLFGEVDVKFLSFVEKESACKTLSGFYRQPPERVGEAVVELIEKGTNGAIWVSQANEPPIEIHVGQNEKIKL